ncbi:MAG: hypothetical protein ACLTTU_12180 [Bilophila wadsworthia]
MPELLPSSGWLPASAVTIAGETRYRPELLAIRGHWAEQSLFNQFVAYLGCCDDLGYSISSIFR